MSLWQRQKIQKLLWQINDKQKGRITLKKNVLAKILKKIYRLLDNRQKLRFLIIIVIMIVSAALTQLTPKAIGWLTDDILNVNGVSFDKIIPFLVLILVVNVVNELIKIIRRVMVEDVATRTEKKSTWHGHPVIADGTFILF